jgi:hypothetical protein
VITHGPEIDRVFVLRFWIESACEGPEKAQRHWRASIRDVNTGRQFHAEGVPGACNVIRRLLEDETKENRQ